MSAATPEQHAELERQREIAREYANTHCPKCNHPHTYTNQDGEPVCDDCGWMP